MARQQRVPESPKSSAYRRSSHKSSKRRKQEETVAAKPRRDVPHDHPDVEQLRRARQGYYAQTAQERERKSRQNIDRSSAHNVTTAATTIATVTVPVKVKKSTPQKSSRVDEHGRKRRKHRTGTTTTTTSNRKKVNRRSRPDKETREHRQESGYVYSNVREDTSTGIREVGGKEKEDGADDRMGSVLSTRRSSLERKERRRSVSPRVIPPEITRTASTRSRTSYRTSDASPKKSKSRRSSGVSSSSREKDAYRSRDFQPANSYPRSTTKVVRSSSNRDHRRTESRPQLKRRTTKVESVRSSRRIVEPVPVVSSTAGGKPSASKTHDRRKSTGLLGSIFAPKPQVPEKKVECLTCLSDDVPASKAAKLSCGHRMCHACLRRIFTMSVTDPQHMPPRCCTQDSIPLKHVDRLFNDKFKILWNRKYQEYTTKNRIYCPARGCGEWIKPSHIHMDSSVGRRYGKCSRCKMKVCCLCNGKWHTRKECPRDEETKRFVEIAKEAGWQRCYNCKAMVELKEGCNHMTCRCTAEFCMLCGNAWKTCDCPWFNYTVITDQLNGMNVPEPIRAMIQQHAAGADGRQQRRRRMPANGNQNPNPRNPALTYQQEMDRRQAQERADEDLARRLQQQTFNEDGDDQDNNNINGLGEAAAAAAARMYVHNYHRYRARREHADRSNGNNRTMRNQNGNDLNANGQMQGRAAMAALAAQLAGVAYNNMRATAAETAAEPATTAPGATAGTTARRAEMRRATAAALARSTASVDLQMEAEGSQQPQASQNQRQRRRESQRRREGRARRAQEDEAATARRASRSTGTAVMAGLARDGRGVRDVRGAGRNGGDGGRVGAWLQHVEHNEEEEEEEKEEEYTPAVPGAWITPGTRSAAIG